MQREWHVQRPRGTVGRRVRELQDVQQQGRAGVGRGEDRQVGRAPAASHLHTEES